MLDQLAQIVFNGVAVGSIIAIGGIGVTLIFGTLKIVNFAHGDYLTFGAYIALLSNVAWHLDLGMAIIVGATGTAILGAALELCLWRPFRARGAGTVTMFIVSIGLSLILRNAITMVWGPEFKSYDVDSFSVYVIGPLRLSFAQLIVIIVAPCSVATIAMVLARTRFGKALRALSDDRDLAAVAGINVDRMIFHTWLLGSALAGLAGILQALLESYFDPNFGVQVMLLIFAAVILGGIGSAYGCLIGGLILGLVMELSVWRGFDGGLEPTYKPVVAFVILILTLILRPQGIFGRPTA